ncbi:MAG: hypothetical protein ACK46L_00130 [Synechococcaceae cyanobacterium]
MNNRPDASTIVFFRERLRKAGLIEEILSCLSSTSDPRVCRPVAAR